MVDIILKLTGSKVDISTASDVNGAVLVRVYAPTEAEVSRLDSSNTVIGSMVMPAGFVEVMEKLKTDKLSANATVWATPLAYK